MISVNSLKSSSINHSFFTREGGHSDGIYEGLNTGLGSDDDRQTVLKNRAYATLSLGAAPDMLVTPFQHHSRDVVNVTEPWTPENWPRADAVVTKVPGIAIAVNTADCTPVLFADDDAGVIGAAHAGWKGAIGGVTDETISSMEALGARRENIAAAIGPTISQKAYEVGPEYHMRFVEDEAGNARFFVPSEKDGHYMFDLPGYVEMRLKRAGLTQVENTNLCTYADEARFFSYRRTTHRGEPDYGRQLTAITLVA
ncbi:MAG: peptidoglycan editing factor PgeF [Hyphomicrobiales bacterium]